MKDFQTRFTSNIFASVLLALLLFTLVAVPGVAVATGNTALMLQLIRSEDTPPGVISARQSGVELTSAQQPWTSTRMMAAKPYPLPEFSAPLTVLSDDPLPSADPVYIPSAPPDSSSPAFPADDLVEGFSRTSLLGYDYPAPFTRFQNFDDYTVFPYSTVGVLFFRQNGGDYRCSAASIGSNAVWTAGHCLHDGSGNASGWSENVVFVPAYKNGNAPFGSWSFYDLVTRVAWFSGGDLRFDMGGVILEPNASNQTLEEVVGNLGFAYNLSPEQHWFNFGYPSAAPFDGFTMQICAGSFARNDPNFSFPAPMAMGCDMTGGASGGPWIINFSGTPGNSNYLNGNNSYRYKDDLLEIYSPYLGDVAKDLLDFISDSTPYRTISIHLPIVAADR
ncbi:MAG: hypothetical protein JSV42_05360 [Chloroflexota bacterium]|nr:MAG: hypothetical protein JSV42_05360 [Chloroflexota bacterium]